METNTNKASAEQVELLRWIQSNVAHGHGRLPAWAKDLIRAKLAICRHTSMRDYIIVATSAGIAASK